MAARGTTISTRASVDRDDFADRADRGVGAASGTKRALADRRPGAAVVVAEAAGAGRGQRIDEDGRSGHRHEDDQLVEWIGRHRFERPQVAPARAGSASASDTPGSATSALVWAT